MTPLAPVPGPWARGDRPPGQASDDLEALVPAPKTLAWMAVVAVAVSIGLQHYQSRKG